MTDIRLHVECFTVTQKKWTLTVLVHPKKKKEKKRLLKCMLSTDLSEFSVTGS